jgi:hypothetical protein
MYATAVEMLDSVWLALVLLIMIWHSKWLLFCY